MVKLRMQRLGKKKAPLYRIVAVDIRVKRDGKFIEILGQYDPKQPPPLFQINEERILHWLKMGARPTDTVRAFLRRTGLWLRWTLTRQGKETEMIEKILERWKTQVAERHIRESDRKLRRKKNKKQAAESAAPAAEAQPQAAATTP